MWKDKYRKMLRKREQVRSKEKIHSRNGFISEVYLTEYLDVVEDFFTECYHLGDWFFGSGECTKEEVYDYINVHDELKLCRDICNGVKHLRLDRQSSEVSDPHRNISLRFEKGPSMTKGEKFGIRIRPVIDGDIEIDIIKTIDLCIDKWDAFIIENGLAVLEDLRFDKLK